MVVRVSQREIIEVNYLLPDGHFKPHPALVLSTDRLHHSDDEIFYAVLISTKQLNPEFTLKIENEWLNKPMAETSYFVPHIVSFFKHKDVTKSTNHFIKQKYFDHIMCKVINSMFDIELE